MSYIQFLRTQQQGHYCINVESVVLWSAGMCAPISLSNNDPSRHHTTQDKHLRPSKTFTAQGYLIYVRFAMHTGKILHIYTILSTTDQSIITCKNRG